MGNAVITGRKRIQSFDDLREASRVAREQFALLKDQRLQELMAAIEATLKQGGGDVSSLLFGLSEAEKLELFAHFPQIVEAVKSASTIDDVLAATRAARAALRVSDRLSGAARPSGDRDLVNVARAVAVAPRGMVRRVVFDLQRLENPPEELWRVIVMWLGIRGRVFFNRLSRRARRR
ncbi:hypothetical protein GCM10019059_36130 [Camelimonas fluminis]|uniref:Uncharacterized protein n=1 Tax=Camelimonas fluminis TaxID=1576911 RepID=A0ABV7UGZ1_9HYPH|nr:hypothetical protein [Camelimonas fluminis]GHE73318.1 hypothetical protein GCM10019059_36130 [Camelimonas fluminis]